MDQETKEALILAYLKGGTTEQEDKDLSEWLAGDEKRQDEFADLKTVSHYLQTEVRKKGRRPHRQRLLWPLVAACAGVFLLLGFTFQYFHARADRVLYENSGTKTARIVLPDLSRVWLAEGSSLSYSRRSFSRKRDVRLSGQAEFDVTKNAASPFRVLTSSLEVTVKGTVFQVRDFPSEDYSTATLAEGAVALRPVSGNDRFNLSVGQRAVYRGESNEMTIEEVPVEQILFRRNGVISIENATIHQIVERIQADFGVSLSAVSLGTPGEIRYTFSYPEKASLGNVLDMLETLTGYRFEAESTSNIINK